MNAQSESPRASTMQYTGSVPDNLAELVESALAGSQSAWNALYVRYLPLVKKVCRLFRLSGSDADDVAQVVWLRLLEHLKDIREPRALPGWISTTARNEALRQIELLRRVRPMDPEVHSHFERADVTDPGENLNQLDRQRALHRGLKNLPAKQRELLGLLVADPAVPYHEISRRLGIPIGSIGPTRARCLEKLRNSEALQAIA